MRSHLLTQVIHFKHKTEGTRKFVTRRGAPSNLAKTTGIWMEGDERTCFSIHNIIKNECKTQGWRQGRARGATAPPPSEEILGSRRRNLAKYRTTTPFFSHFSPNVGSFSPSVGKFLEPPLVRLDMICE